VVKPFTVIAIILLSLWGSLSSASSITATAFVDRQSITVEDSLTLTISINDVGTYKTPDLSALEKDFQIAGTSQTSRRSLVNGRSASTTEWITSLYPKKEGLLLIPAIKINDAVTKPIAIQVNKAFTLPAEQLDVAFIENSISHSEAYVKQQILLNVTIYHSIQLDDMNVSELNIEGAIVKQVSQNSFYRTVKGIRHRAHEINYAIFAENPGELVIAPQKFTARALGQGRVFMSGGKLLSRLSKAHTIIVKPAPASYKTNIWLPAENLSLQETWSSDPDQLHASDSITRSITIKADGVTAAQLPPVVFNATPGIKLYPDKPITNNSEANTGISATRVDSTALIATRPGEINLPAITVHWWDTKNNRAKTASIPARTIQVLPALEPDSNNLSNGINHNLNQPAQATAPQVITEVNPFWMITSCILLGLWLITSLAYWRLKNNAKPLGSPQPAETSEKILSEKKAFQRLQKACRHNELSELRPLLIQWAQCHWPHASIHTMSDIAQHSNSLPLSNLLLQFDNSRYGKTQDSSDWNAESLLTLVSEIRKQAIDAKLVSTALPNLYR
jgi:hypothetical protein